MVCYFSLYQFAEQFVGGVICLCQYIAVVAQFLVLFSFVLHYSRGGARAPQAGLGGILRRERAGQVLVQQAHWGGQLDTAAILGLEVRVWSGGMWCVLVCSGRGVRDAREGVEGGVLA